MRQQSLHGRHKRIHPHRIWDTGTDAAKISKNERCQVIRYRWMHLNFLLSIRQSLLNNASPLTGRFANEGAGVLNSNTMLESFSAYTPHFSIHPQHLNLSHDSWFPFNLQSLCFRGAAITVNCTLMNPFRSEYIQSHSALIIYTCDGEGDGGDCKSSSPSVPILSINVMVSKNFNRPFSWISFHFSTTAEFKSPIRGNIMLLFNLSTQTQALRIPFDVRVDSSPDKKGFILWDQYHSISYPIRIATSDENADSSINSFPFDHLGDHLSTNYLDLFLNLKARNYHVDSLTERLQKHHASTYGTLILCDVERDLTAEEEVVALNHFDNLLIFLEWTCWYLPTFFDASTNIFLRADVCGMAPSFKRLLDKLNIGVENAEVDGVVLVNGTSHRVRYKGVAICRGSGIFYRVNNTPILLMTRVRGVKVVVFGDSEPAAWVIDLAFDYFAREKNVGNTENVDVCWPSTIATSLLGFMHTVSKER